MLQQASEIATDLHALSHELHSAKLDHLGITRAMSSWCREFSQRQKVEIEFKNDDVPTPPHEISLCLLWVLQEAVHNAAKHGGVDMQERVRLVGGTIVIESKSMGGTTVHVRVPLESKERFQRAAV
jgi:signal transduction histidine kinase